MVCIKQVSIPAVVLLSIAEQAAAAPLGRQTGIAARDANEAVGSIDLATRQPGIASIAKKVGSVIKKNPGKTLDRGLSTANTGMAIANTHKTQQGKRDIEEINERDLEDEIELALRDMGFDERDWEDLEERGFATIAKAAAKGVVSAAKKVGSVIKKNPGKTFDRTLSTANTGMAIANTNKAMKGKRDVEDIEERDDEELDVRDVMVLDERDLEELELALRDLEDRSLMGFLKPVVKATKAVSRVAGKAFNVVKNNKGKTFDRVLSTANTAMNVANTNKAQKGKRDLEEVVLALRDLGEVDERDLEELEERDLEELELALRDIVDLEDRSLMGVLKPMVKATKAVSRVAGKVFNTVKNNKGKTFDRVLSTANTGMAIANTNKAMKGKRDFEDIEERDIEELELALRDLEDRSLMGFLKPVVKATKAVSRVAGKAFNAVKNNKGKTFDRVLSTANTGMAVANTNKAMKGKRDFEDMEERDFEDIEERDFDDMEERDFEDIEERDWEDVEERDFDELEARGVGAILKKVAKGALRAGDIIAANQGKSYNRANAAANAAMNAANTKKKQEKRYIEELGFEERDFDYLNNLSQRDLEDLELVVRSIYVDELDLE